MHKDEINKLEFNVRFGFFACGIYKRLHFTVHESWEI